MVLENFLKLHLKKKEIVLDLKIRKKFVVRKCCVKANKVKIMLWFIDF